MNNRSAARPRVRATVTTVAVMTAALVGAAAIADISIVAAFLVAAGLAAPVIHRDMREARTAALETAYVERYLDSVQGHPPAHDIAAGGSPSTN